MKIEMFRILFTHPVEQVEAVGPMGDADRHPAVKHFWQSISATACL
jgi:hypothetical protein